MYFFNEACLLIACNKSWPAGCDPLPSTDERFADAFLLRVRNAGIDLLAHLRLCENCAAQMLFTFVLNRLCHYAISYIWVAD
jgi:hypothetical protein